MKFFMVALAALALAGCDDYIQASPADHGPFQVKLLLEHDGCKVYRFTDGYHRYFVRCEGASSSQASWNETHRIGKMSPTEHYDAQTEESPR